MSQVPETPHRPVLSLLTGHFNETSGYRAYREHGVGDWLMIHTIDGLGRFGHAGGDLTVAPGDWILLRPGTPHDYGVETSLQHWELLWAHFHPRTEWLDWLEWPEVATGIMRLQPVEADSSRLAGLFGEVHRLHTSTLPRREAFAMNALETLLLGCDLLNPRAAATELDPRVQRALDYLDRHIAEKVLLDDVALGIGLSASRLAHLFRAETGQTPQAYLEDLRMRRAADLLTRTGLSVKRVASDVGFDNPFYFSQRFSRRMGMSPVAFRRLQGGAPREDPS